MNSKTVRSSLWELFVLLFVFFLCAAAREFPIVIATVA